VQGHTRLSGDGDGPLPDAHFELQVLYSNHSHSGSSSSFLSSDDGHHHSHDEDMHPDKLLRKQEKQELNTQRKIEKRERKAEKKERKQQQQKAPFRLVIVSRSE
jgi:hypothetical protein